MIVNEAECLAAGIDPRRVGSIARRIERAALEAQALGVQIFGGSDGSLRYYGLDHSRPLILADMSGNWSGGDGSAGPDEDGLMRGE
jgi:hypothetical protein